MANLWTGKAGATDYEESVAYVAPESGEFGLPTDATLFDPTTGTITSYDLTDSGEFDAWIAALSAEQVSNLRALRLITSTIAAVV